MSAWMVVREDHCSCIQAQCFLDHLARVNRCTVDGAAEHLHVLDQVMLGIQKQRRENLVFETCQLGDQVFLDQFRRSEGSTALGLQIDDLASSRQDLIGSGRQVATLLVANQQGRVKSERKLRHDRAPVTRATLPDSRPARRSAAVRGRQPARRKRALHAQPLTARTP
ncbi:hypothetical protein D3C86_1643150 [compost metagenome]